MKSSPSQGLKQTGKIYIYGNYIFLNEFDRGIHIFDNTQPASPKNIAFIPIPGNQDMAVTGNTLYADSYSDLVTFRYQRSQSCDRCKVYKQCFPYRNVYYTYQGVGVNVTTRPANTDSIKVIVGWTRHDTTYAYKPRSGPVLSIIMMPPIPKASPVPNRIKPARAAPCARFTPYRIITCTRYLLQSCLPSISPIPKTRSSLISRLSVISG